MVDCTSSIFIFPSLLFPPLFCSSFLWVYAGSPDNGGGFGFEVKGNREVEIYIEALEVWGLFHFGPLYYYFCVALALRVRVYSWGHDWLASKWKYLKGKWFSKYQTLMHISACVTAKFGFPDRIFLLICRKGNLLFLGKIHFTSYDITIFHITPL